MSKQISACLLASLFGFAPLTAAEPVLDARIEIAGESLYPDDRLEHVFYRPPLPVRLVHHEDGRPDIDLTLTYYLGSALRDDAGTHEVRWALRLGIERGPRGRGDEPVLRDALARRAGADRTVVIRPLPILGIPASVEYAPIDTPEERIRLNEGHLDSAREALDGAGPGRADGDPGSAARAGGAQWSRRSLSFALERHDGTVLREAMEAGGALMSLSFAYRVAGVERDTSEADVAYRRVERLLGSDALRVRVDAKRYPEFLRVVDLNATAPPGYPSLTVICSDFLVDAASWRYEEKEVELEAVGVTGKPIRTRVYFPGDDPMASLRRAAFPYAIRVDQPYRFRVRSYAANGGERRSAWVTASTWAAPLDVTGELEEESH